jgi:hypothetical protein
MPDTTDAALDGMVSELTPRHLIRKYGVFYRPNERGYTGSAILAGRYTLEQAEKITHPNGPDGPRDGMSFIHEDDLQDDDWKEFSALRAERDKAIELCSKAQDRWNDGIDERERLQSALIGMTAERDAARALADAPPAVRVIPLVIGEAALENLLDRRGLREPLEDIKYGDPNIWREICDDTGRAALAALQPQAEGGDA